jgi:hypothetical protein
LLLGTGVVHSQAVKAEFKLGQGLEGLQAGGARLTRGALKSLEHRCRLVSLAVFFDQRGAEDVPRWKLARWEMLELGSIPLPCYIRELKKQLFSHISRGMP